MASPSPRRRLQFEQWLLVRLAVCALLLAMLACLLLPTKGFVTRLTTMRDLRQNDSQAPLPVPPADADDPIEYDPD
jgi:hypothetical protein